MSHLEEKVEKLYRDFPQLVDILCRSRHRQDGWDRLGQANSLIEIIEEKFSHHEELRSLKSSLYDVVYDLVKEMSEEVIEPTIEDDILELKEGVSR